MKKKLKKMNFKWLITIALAGTLFTTGCLATKLLIPGGEPLTVEESAKLDTVKNTVVGVVASTGWFANHITSVLVPGGAGTAILSLLGTYLYRRRKKGND